MKVEKRLIACDDPLIAGLPEHHPMVEESIELEAWFVDDEPVVLLGFAPVSLISSTAYVWSWAFPAVKRYPKTLLRVSRRSLKDALDRYPILYGHCHINSPWLRFLGAKITLVDPPFATFTIEAQ